MEKKEFEIYFGPDGEIYNQDGKAIFFMDFLEMLKKNGVEINEMKGIRKYSTIEPGELHYEEKEGECDILEIRI